MDHGIPTRTHRINSTGNNKGSLAHCSLGLGINFAKLFMIQKKKNEPSKEKKNLEVALDAPLRTAVFFKKMSCIFFLISKGAMVIWKKKEEKKEKRDRQTGQDRRGKLLAWGEHIVAKRREFFAESKKPIPEDY